MFKYPWIEDIDRNTIFNNPDFLEIKEHKNKNWMVTVSYDLTKSATVVFDSMEMIKWDRGTIIGVDSYIEYEGYFREPESNKKCFTAYLFIEKIIDENNNLIIIAVPDAYEIDDYEFVDIDEK